MSININTVKELVQLIVNKNEGQWSISRFNQAAPSAVIEWFNACYGQPMLSKNGQQINDMVWQSTEKLSNNLRPFLKPVTLQVNANGQGVRPTDFVQTSSIRYNYGTKQVEVKFVRDNNLDEYLNSDLLAPSKSYPIYAIYDNYLQFYPKDLVRVNFTYLRTPATPVWGYTVVNGRPVYDQTTSVDIDFPDDNLNEVVSRIVALFGITMREGQVQQYAAQKISTGS